MKRLLYVGNKLSSHGSNTTAIETLGPMLEREGFTLRYASSKKNKVLRLLDMAMATLRFARSSGYVLIDTYSTSNFWYAFTVSQLCRLLRTPYIPILHGGDLPKRLAQNPRLCRLIFAHAFVNVAPSGYLLEAFGRAGFGNVILIPNAIAIQDYPFKKRENIGPKLLWVRSFAPLYNPEMALGVLAEVAKQFPDAVLCMVGPDKDGNLEKLRQKAFEWGISVEFTGRLPKSEWIRLSETYDIFINTTHKDNTPVSVIEAMALGLAVVSTNVGGLPFLLEDHQTALLVPDNDHQKMADCVIDLLKNATLHDKLVQNAYSFTRKFDEANVAAQWLGILK
jgi:glycosyltransferase involved in cell wall biosynthesis